ncbi:MAG: hypothetical protein JO182_25315, partial [Acidobacteriaceae bacterium]|nr:hypothetical protein [Acidobacteriaceae bacterium]
MQHNSTKLLGNVLFRHVVTFYQLVNTMQYRAFLSFCGTLLPLALLIGGANGPCFSQTNVLTYHNDNVRTGQNLTETALLPSTVNASRFGKLFTVPTDG